MSQSRGVRKLRSSSNCFCIQKNCLQQLNQQVFDMKVKRFLGNGDQINCQKINCQSFTKPKADPQIVSAMKQLGVKQQGQANQLIILAKKAQARVFAIIQQQVQTLKIVQSQQKGQHKPEKPVEGKFNEEYDIMEGQNQCMEE